MIFLNLTVSQKPGLFSNRPADVRVSSRCPRVQQTGNLTGTLFLQEPTLSNTASTTSPVLLELFTSVQPETTHGRHTKAAENGQSVNEDPEVRQKRHICQIYS
ncbi:hypothetical protein RRG08_055159 [Elysia crispata]|uniref:Uncharacterized protein n=1 Tax=Elysia crispata TaxID=231223 RepID=A0AAE0XR89_9GAST|nr:hypothetical protein RRG08_055159 [Elysia crispata]